MGQRTVRAPMPPSRRAKQFMAFDALKGLKEAIADRERLPTPRVALTEERIQELNSQLLNLQAGQIVTITYYGQYEQEYIQLTGPVTKIDGYWKQIQIGAINIDFHEIAQINRAED